MDNSERMKVILQLRDISKEHLIKSSYGVDDPDCQDDYQIKQYHAVCDAIQKIYLNQQAVLEKVLKSVSVLIPTVEEVEGYAHMQNIATSASQCLDLLRDTTHGLYPKQEVKQCVEYFLKSVGWQARKACKDDEVARGSSKVEPKSDELPNEPDKAKFIDTTQIQLQIDESIRRYFKEYIENIESEAKAQKDFFEEVSNKISQDLNEAKSKVADAEETAKTLDTTVREAKDSADNATNAAKSAKETADAILPNMLSVLGILVGIVVAVVGCYLSILLGEHSNDIKNLMGYSRPFEFARYLFMGHLTTMVVFLLMYLISRISKHTLSCSCNRFNPVAGYKEPDVHDCTKCTKRCGVQTRFARRYPYLFGINMACCMGYALLLMWQFINVYFRKQFDEWIINTGFWGIMCLMFFVGFCGYIIICALRKQPTPNN